MVEMVLQYEVNWFNSKKKNVQKTKKKKYYFTHIPITVEICISHSINCKQQRNDIKQNKKKNKCEIMAIVCIPNSSAGSQ